MKLHSYKYNLCDQDLLARLSMLNSCLDENVGLTERIEKMRQVVSEEVPKLLEEIQELRGQTRCDTRQHIHVLQQHGEIPGAAGAGMYLEGCDVCGGVRLQHSVIMGGSDSG